MASGVASAIIILLLSMLMFEHYFASDSDSDISSQLKSKLRKFEFGLCSLKIQVGFWFGWGLKRKKEKGSCKNGGK